MLAMGLLSILLPMRLVQPKKPLPLVILPGKLYTLLGVSMGNPKHPYLFHLAPMGERRLPGGYNKASFRRECAFSRCCRLCVSL